MSIDVSPTQAFPREDATRTLTTRWEAAKGVMSPGRYRLYVSYACPWSHRVLIARALSKLENAVELVEVEPEMDDIGWRMGGHHLADCYRAYAPGYIGKASVPLMIEIENGQAVSNTSADLMRMFGTWSSDFGHLLYPAEYAAECDVWNADVETNVNKRVYQFGFAASKEEKDMKTSALMKTFLNLDDLLAKRRYLASSDTPLEPDWRLWTTLARYELAYRPFMLSRSALPLLDLPNLARFFDDLLTVQGIPETYRPDEIVAHYSARLRDFKIDHC